MIRSTCVTLLALSVTVAAQRPIDGLVEAERSFASAARVQGWRAAFLDYFADDAIAFSPAPEPAKPRLRSRPGRPFTEEELTWEPRTGDIAASGDLGWLTGPSTFVDRTSKEPPQYGNYMSIWKRQADGRWRVYIDMGMSVPGPAPFAPGFSRMAMPSRYTGATTKEEATRTLLETDRRFNTVAAAESPKAAYVRYASPDARLYRNGSGTFAAVGATQIGRWLDEHSSQIGNATVSGEAAGSGDLGYTYGTSTAPDASSPGSYVRVWARTASGEWLLQADALAPARRQ